MKKKRIQYLILIAVTIVCIVAFVFTKSNLQANFLSSRTNLQKNETFAIRNHTTDNVYILQYKEKWLSLYRKQEDGTLLRYTITDEEITSDETKNGQWMQSGKLSLPASPTLLTAEIKSLLNGKTDSTDTIKQYADLLIGAFSTVYNDSSVLIDYNALADAFHKIASLLKERESKKMIKIKKDISATKVVTTFSPFACPTLCEKVIDILSEAVQQQYRESIQNALLQSCNTLQVYDIQVTTSIFGTFIGLEIYKNNECIFDIEKLK